MSILNKRFPEVARKINREIERTVPQYVLTDLSKIDVIIKTFLQIKGIESIQWTNHPGQKRITDVRAELIGVVMMFYHPERLLGYYQTGKTKNGIVKTLNELTGCSTVILSLSVNSVIVLFKAYADYRETVYELYHEIEARNEFFLTQKIEKQL